MRGGVITTMCPPPGMFAMVAVVCILKVELANTPAATRFSCRLQSTDAAVLLSGHFIRPIVFDNKLGYNGGEGKQLHRLAKPHSIPEFGATCGFNFRCLLPNKIMTVNIGNKMYIFITPITKLSSSECTDCIGVLRGFEAVLQTRAFDAVLQTLLGNYSSASQLDKHLHHQRQWHEHFRHGLLDHKFTVRAAHYSEWQVLECLLMMVLGDIINRYRRKIIH